MAALSPPDRARCRYHCGYLNVQETSTYVLGVPAAIPQLFMIEGAMDRLIPEIVPKVIQLLDRLDCLECELFGGAPDFASYKQVDKVIINEKRFAEMGRYYRLAMQSLCSILGVPPNPYDPRDYVAGNSLNARVQH